MGVGPLRDADHRAGAAVHSLVRHRHLVESDRGDHAGAVSGGDQYRGRIAHHQRTADRDAALVRRHRRQIFFKVSLPSAVPFILAGLKLGIGRGLIGVVVAELFGSRAGLGRLISQSSDAFNMPDCLPASWFWRLPASS